MHTFVMFPHGTVYLLCVDVMAWNQECWQSNFLNDISMKNSSLVCVLSQKSQGKKQLGHDCCGHGYSRNLAAQVTL